MNATNRQHGPSQGDQGISANNTMTSSQTQDTASNTVRWIRSTGLQAWNDFANQAAQQGPEPPTQSEAISIQNWNAFANQNATANIQGSAHATPVTGPFQPVQPPFQARYTATTANLRHGERLMDTMDWEYASHATRDYGNVVLDSSRNREDGDQDQAMNKQDGEHTPQPAQDDPAREERYTYLD